MALIQIGTDLLLKKPQSETTCCGARTSSFSCLRTFGGGGTANQTSGRFCRGADLGQYITYRFLHGDWMHLLGNISSVDFQTPCAHGLAVLRALLPGQRCHRGRDVAALNDNRITGPPACGGDHSVSDVSARQDHDAALVLPDNRLPDRRDHPIVFKMLCGVTFSPHWTRASQRGLFRSPGGYCSALLRNDLVAAGVLPRLAV